MRWMAAGWHRFDSSRVRMRRKRKGKRGIGGARCEGGVCVYVHIFVCKDGAGILLCCGMYGLGGYGLGWIFSWHLIHD